MNLSQYTDSRVPGNVLNLNWTCGINFHINDKGNCAAHEEE